MEENKLIDAPLVILDETVLYPNVYLDFENISDPSFIKSLEIAQKDYDNYFIMSYKKNKNEIINSNNIGEIGVLCEILDLQIVDNKLKLIYEIHYRFNIKNIVQKEMENQVLICSGTILKEFYQMEDRNFQNLFIAAFKNFNLYLRLSDPTTYSTLKANHLSDINEIEPSILVSLFFTYFDLSHDEKITFLTTINTQDNLLKMNNILKEWIDTHNQNLKINQQISKKTSENMEKAQKEYILKEQLKTIKKELNELNDVSPEVEELFLKFKALNLPEKISTKLVREFERLSNMAQNSAEYQNIENYLYTVVDYPWNKSSDSLIDLNLAKKILDNDHFGLEMIKQRILEYLAVKKLNPNYKGQIICLFGPPGVGKTSICKSIAKSLNREYVRVSLGGVSDESEIRGHRKTYVGSMPGKIIQSLISAKTNNPVIVLDELDKIGFSQTKGSVESALLEVLDPEQNQSFNDHYMGIPVDLSQVIFIATANDISKLSLPLLDRMDLIEMESYTVLEKLKIAKNHILNQEIEKIGFNLSDISFSDSALLKIINEYTREAGVRMLRQQIANILRKLAINYVKNKTIKINEKTIISLIGEPIFVKESRNKIDRSGIATGLAWTPFGGDVLLIETLLISGQGSSVLTGTIGDVMKESIHIAKSVIKSKNNKFITKLKANDLHIHFPAGAIPKDGPSAGITIASAIYSLLLDKKIKTNLAMTGELSLSGKILPVGGIKEKIIAAYNNGYTEIILPLDNKKDLLKVPQEIINNKKIKIHLVKDIDSVLKLIF
jgi:ATP-dependent Lon protease